MQIEGTKLIFVMNFSLLDFFRFASRIPQIAQVKLVSTFKIAGGGGGGHAPRQSRLSKFGGGGGGISSIFSISNSRL